MLGAILSALWAVMTVGAVIAVVVFAVRRLWGAAIVAASLLCLIGAVVWLASAMRFG